MNASAFSKEVMLARWRLNWLCLGPSYERPRRAGKLNGLRANKFEIIRDQNDLGALGATAMVGQGIGWGEHPKTDTPLRSIGARPHRVRGHRALECRFRRPLQFSLGGAS